MSGLLKNLEYLQNFDHYIKREKTGNAEEFARKLGMSRSALYDFIDEVKLLGADVCYCATRRTFYYAKPWHFEIGSAAQAKIQGGKQAAKSYLWMNAYTNETNTRNIFHCPEIPDNWLIL